MFSFSQLYPILPEMNLIIELNRKDNLFFLPKFIEDNFHFTNDMLINRVTISLWTREISVDCGNTCQKLLTIRNNLKHSG